MKNRGFTLIELLVVISIIALLSSIVLTSLGGARTKANVSATNTAVLQYRNAIEIFALDHGGDYPLTSTLATGGCLGNYYPISTTFARCGAFSGTQYGIHSLASSLAAAISGVTLSLDTVNQVTIMTPNGNTVYISRFPPVSTKPFVYDGTNNWLGAIYVCETLDSNNGNQCKTARIDWYLEGTNQTCVSGAIVNDGDPSYYSTHAAYNSTKCTIRFGS